MKLVLALAVGASAFGGFGKKSAAPAISGRTESDAKAPLATF